MKELIKFGKNLEKRCEKKVIRRLKDMRSRYQDQKGVKKILKRKNPIIYKVLISKFGKLVCGLTVMEPGDINKEFYFTKGHKHKRPSGELYILLQGKAKLILQDDKPKTVELKKNKPYLVKENQAHRIVNIHNKKTKVLTVYYPRVGQDYNVKFKKRLFK
jgi:oxalate decarboxylase/phosphoglucose isomerase-like protein (cupin superfamily)